MSSKLNIENLLMLQSFLVGNASISKRQGTSITIETGNQMKNGRVVGVIVESGEVSEVKFQEFQEMNSCTIRIVDITAVFFNDWSTILGEWVPKAPYKGRALAAISQIRYHEENGQWEQARDVAKGAGMLKKFSYLNLR